ncbi:general stress protein [Lunatimonas lonarensis]|uniref:General stress protein n=1 Tax=Lunatimonas lonarensis TaxID=1232681 RepID=R7ZSI5_9BACT|nr:bacillithiol system redox-active protein YtxJ [Lunatimonas lonarensis]EON77013.1 general stress protein [Lunatimonas lonarensis]
MSWKKLEEITQIDQLIEESKTRPVVVFKHSTRCSISSMAWNRITRSWKDEDSQKVEPYYLDLIAYRAISDAIASRFAVPHASPQVILIKNGEAVYDTSHMGINYEELMDRSN